MHLRYYTVRLKWMPFAHYNKELLSKCVFCFKQTHTPVCSDSLETFETFPGRFQNPFSGWNRLPPRRRQPTNGQICKPRRAAVCKCALMPPESRPRSFYKHEEMVNHRLSFYHIWRLRQPPQRVGPQRKVPRGRDRWWLAALPCDWQAALSGCAGSSGCWHSPKVRTALTDNGDVPVARPRSSCPLSGDGRCEETSTGLDSGFGPLLLGPSLLSTRLVLSLALLEKWQRSDGPPARWASRRTLSPWRRWSERKRDAGQPERMLLLPATTKELMRPSWARTRGRGLTGRAPVTEAASVQAWAPVS